MRHFADRLDDRQVLVYLAAISAGSVLGLVAPGVDGFFEILIYPVLGLLLYVTFLQVPFFALKDALHDLRFLAAIFALNFLVVPPVVYLLSRLAPDVTAVELGLLMVLLTPCIDYVIVFTRLAGGSDGRLLAATPLLMLAQLVLLPLYLWLFMGPELSGAVSSGPFIEAFMLLIALPLVLAWATETWAGRKPAGARVKQGLKLTPVPFMALTLLVVVASQLPRVEGRLDDVVAVVPIYVAFLLVMALIGRQFAIRLRFDAPTGRALLFSGATRNSLVVLPLALALGDAYSLTAAVIVTQTLVEVIGMVTFIRVVPRMLPDRG